MASPTWYLYIVKCADKTLYTGITTDVDRRFAEHCSGGAKAAKYLRGKAPLELVYRQKAGNRSEASQLEYQIKQMSRQEKMALVDGEN